MAKRKTEGDGAGRGIALVLILIELCGAFYLGMTLLDSFGTDALQAVSFSKLIAGVVGVIAYIVLHVIPGIRWLMMAAMIFLWAFVAYSLGLIVIGEQQDGLKMVTHKGPYIAAVIAGLFRGVMYR